MADVAPVFQKPTFDARIQYYELLRAVLAQGKQAAVLNDHHAWYRCLRITYNMVHAYVTPELRKDIEDSLSICDTLVTRLYFGPALSDNTRRNTILRVDKLLFGVDKSIHEAAKRMFLPLENNMNGEFDMQRFLEESDLAQ